MWLLIIVVKPSITFQPVTGEVLKTKLQWLDPKYKGKFIRSPDIDPAKPNKLNKEELYTDQEKKKLKPNDDCKNNLC